MKGPETKRLMETKFGKFTKLFTRPRLSASSFDQTGSTTFGRWKPNAEGRLVWPRIKSKFKAWTFLRTTPFRGVADWESFQGGEDRKRGPWNGAIHLENGGLWERWVQNGGVRNRAALLAVPVKYGRVLLFELLAIMFLMDLKIAILDHEAFIILIWNS